MSRAAVITGLVCLFTALAAPAATAQDQYILSDTNDDWEAVATPDPDSPEGRFAAARRALAAGEARRAERLASEWIKAYPAHPLLPDAYVLRGDALFAQRSYYDSLFDYEFVARGFPASEAFITALEREFDVATLFAQGTKRKLWGLRILNAGEEAEELLIRIQERLPGSRLAEQAAMELADYYFRKRRMALAAEMYSIFLSNHPDSVDVSKARRRLIYAYLATFKGPAFDASGIHEARVRLVELIRLEPATAQQVGAEGLLAWIDEKDAEKLLLTARWYEKRGDPISAEMVLRRLLRRYPRTVAARNALRLADKIVPLLAPGVLDDAPDYAALRRAILGEP